MLPYKADESALPEECRQVRRLLHSEAMLVILSEMTGVILHPLAGAKQEEGEEAAAEKEKKDEVCAPYSLKIDSSTCF